MSTAKHASVPPGARPGVGPLLRDWRMRRRRSQMDLALDAGVSPRHLSYIETGRARPSPATLLALAQCLEVPLRERNDLLLAAGFAPRYAERTLDATEMASARAALERILAAHDPLPGLVVDRLWNVVLANQGASMLAQLLPPALREPTINVFRASLHPDGLARYTRNLAEWTPIALGALRRQAQRFGDARLQALLTEVQSYPNVQAALADRALPAAGAPMPLIVPYELDLPDLGAVRFFTTLTTFGTPRDITLEELCVELFYPADDASASQLRAAVRGT
ncbi:MAG: helix-turn-helix domain-containing protein [Burkholderiales bacterium]|nr:helix-turn-helix domain-containing protein [Burkholderiales bacterium]